MGKNLKRPNRVVVYMSDAEKDELFTYAEDNDTTVTTVLQTLMRQAGIIGKGDKSKCDKQG